MAKHIAYLGFYRPHEPVDHPGGGELLTRQEFADECDINNIIAEFKQTNIIRHVNQQAAKGLFIDLPDMCDYQEALLIKERAELAFASLPSKTRAEWDNDPELLLHAINDPRQREKLVELGILNKPEELATPEPKPDPSGPPQKPPAQPPAAAAAASPA